MDGTAVKCAECHVEMTATDLEFAVPTEAGPVHRECFEGPLPPGMAIDEDTAVELARAELEAENQRREEVGDPPVDVEWKTSADLPADASGAQLRQYAEALGMSERCAEGDHDRCDGCGCGCHRDVDDGLDRRDPEDERGLREAAEEEGRSC